MDGKEVWKLKKRGEITVFLSLCLLSVAALICVMVEGARSAGSRVYLQIAANGSLDTLFGQYHRELWKKYRLFGVEYQKMSGVERQLESYVNRYQEVENWYPIRLQTLTVTSQKTLGSQGGDRMMEEILDYMKYGIWEQLLISPEKGEDFWNDIKEAAAAGGMTDTYEGQSVQVKQVERAVERLADCVEDQEKLAGEIALALDQDDVEGFEQAAKRFQKENSKMDGLFRAYEKSAQKLRKVLEHGEQELDQAAEDMQENREMLFRQQMDPFRSYVDSDGERYRQIQSQMELSAANGVRLRETEEIVDRLKQEYEEREQQRDEEDEEEEKLSLSEAWEHWNGYGSAAFTIQKGKKDEQKQQALEQVSRMVKGSLLELVLPDGMAVSGEKWGGDAGRYANQTQESLVRKNGAQWVLIHEYCGEFLTHALDHSPDYSPDHSPGNDGGRYQLEYLLHGKDNDRSNLENTVSELFLIRQGINLIQILSDTEKREAAQSLAAVITGIIGIAPLVEVMSCFIMTVWAMGEALEDVRCLMAGGNVPLWKSADEWKLSLEGLLSMGMGRTARTAGDTPGQHTPGQPKNSRGMDYEQYLKWMLFTVDQGKKQTRIMDVVQAVIQKDEPGFRLENCICDVDIQVKGCGKHVFFALPFVEKLVGGQEGYELLVQAAKAY